MKTLRGNRPSHSPVLRCLRVGALLGSIALAFASLAPGCGGSTPSDQAGAAGQSTGSAGANGAAGTSGTGGSRQGDASTACGAPGAPCCGGNSCDGGGCCIPMAMQGGAPTRVCVGAGQTCSGTNVAGTCQAGSCMSSAGGPCGAVSQACCGGAAASDASVQSDGGPTMG